MHATEWRPVVGYENHYEVSDQGDVRRTAHGYGAQAGYILKLQVQANNYVKIHLCANGKPSAHWVHRLVCMAFHGTPASENLQVCHGNGNPSDNRASNLRWGTVAENHADKILHGTRWDMSSGYCRDGHVLTEESLKIDGRGVRRCRVCAIAKQREKRAIERSGKPAKQWVHGTRRMYKKGCRCGECRAANTAYQRERMSKKSKENSHE